MAFPSTYNFNYYRGDTAQFVVRPKNSNDSSSFNLSGYTGLFTIADQRGSSGVLSQVEADAVVDDVTDVVTCTITPSVGRDLEAGTYVYDIQIDNESQVFTLLTGTITVTDDITGAVV
jgi:hypothetical protein